MKKPALAVLAAVMIIASAIVVFAGEYTVYDHDWNSNYDNGTVRIEWEKCDSSTKYKVIVFRKGLNSSKAGFGTQVLTKTVSGNKLDVTDVIRNKGTGLYSYSITPTKSPDPLDDMAVSTEEFEADADFVKRARSYSTGSVEPGSGNGWARTPNGWCYLENGDFVRNAWRNISGYWYYFNGSGDMLTGWQLISHKYYYLTPVQGQGGYPQGACWMNRTTPDGYTVNINGEWTVNGVVQAR